jgi:hypothetical protein
VSSNEEYESSVQQCTYCSLKLTKKYSVQFIFSGIKHTKKECNECMLFLVMILFLLSLIWKNMKHRYVTWIIVVLTSDVQLSTNNTAHTTWIFCGYRWCIWTFSRMYHGHICCEITNTCTALEKEYSSFWEQICVKCHNRIAVFNWGLF